MAELKRKDDELTTADLAGRSEKAHEAEGRPQLVRNEQRPVPAEADAAAPVWRDNPEKPTAAGTQKPSVKDHSSQEIRDSGAAVADQPTPLFQGTEVAEFRSRWSSVQTAFVDEPRRAVEDADNLVASLMKKLAEGFANERSRLEGQWDRGDNVSTEDLRLALQRYRSFFDRLLKV
jgi:hypothetical protein